MKRRPKSAIQNILQRYPTEGVKTVPKPKVSVQFIQSNKKIPKRTQRDNFVTDWICPPPKEKEVLIISRKPKSCTKLLGNNVNAELLKKDFLTFPEHSNVGIA
jgi:hypothetical protein